MSTRRALIVGVETYRDPEIPRFEYAEADARALAACWPADEVVLLLNDDATKTLIESRLRKLNQQREEGDILELIYLGHGFNFEGENYLSCNDTLSDDLDLTSLPLESLATRGNIDACWIDGARGALTDPFEPRTIPGTAFTACAANEVSYVSPLLGHGLWAFQLAERLQAPPALNGAELQQAFENQLPLALRKVFNDDVPRSQTPQLIGDAASYAIKDASDGAPAGTNVGALHHVVLSGVRAGKIKNLSGYNKQWHDLPEEINAKTSALIESLGSEEIEEHAQALFQAIKAAFKYKRREIDCDVGEGCASIRTTDFEVDINIVIDPEDLSGYLIETAVRRFKSPEVVQTEAFTTIFHNAFNVLRFDFNRAFDIEDIIDAIEDLEDEAINVAYPPDCTSASITSTQLEGEILFDQHGFRIQLQRSGPPEALLTSFVAAQEMLGAERLLPEQ